MGSSQSRANDSASSSDTASSAPPAPSRTSSSQSTDFPRRRLSTFNRLSSLSKRQGFKRDRDARSLARLEQGEAKKARKRDLSPCEQAEEAKEAGERQETPEIESPSAIETPVMRPVQDENVYSADSTTPTTASISTLATPSVIDVDAPFASSSSSSHPVPSPAPTVFSPNPLSPSVDRLLNRFRRQSLPSQATPPRIADRLTALLGFFSPAQNTNQASDDSSSASRPDDEPQPTTAEMIRDVTRRLSDARRELDATQRQIDETRQRIEQREQMSAALEAEISGRVSRTTTEPASPMRRRIPAGAVLVIQGLAQTETASPAPDNVSANSTPAGSPSANDSSRPFFPRLRRMSEGNTPQSDENDNSNGASIETQARMIGGLLTVAAAATASTLLTPDASTSSAVPNPTPNRSAAAQALSNLMDRIRPSRLRSSQSVEAALGSYLRGVLRDSRQLDSQNATGQGDSDTTDQISDSFQSFLEFLQADLVESVRAFVAPADESVGESSDETTTNDPTNSQTSEPRATEELPIPSFHRQLGQNIPGERNTTGVVGGQHGLPRRLNFFRAHLFPPVSMTSDDAASTGGQPEDTMVPCIFIGVRSISHDPSLTTEDLVQHPSFPFVNGTVPAEESTGEASGAEDTSAPTPPSSEAYVTHPSSTTTDRRTLRERVLERLSPRRPVAPTALHTYLVYVIGGNYPSDHPVLRIPNLATGGPLTDEEMVLVGELMGSVKPPVATREDIEKAGLMTLDGAEMVAAAERGDVLSSCVERCLVSLTLTFASLVRI
ncbi:hypothetical protein BCR39DRAFT_524188 [Naematelia encephala]|uniref:Uncharacterized protein n=1 Tax=Naematelia encephala TaxID=71784 RepID=A0A1Y2BB99_9TREE|nr:hypothetical protein BCR39DRAFT_524188 [Naematelia encephala]